MTQCPMTDTLLPAFRKPPVVETVLGVQFDPIPGFGNAHLGAFWKWLIANSTRSFDERWTTISDAPPIEPAFERFGESQVWSPDELRIRVGRPSLRLQIRNSVADAMIQVQDTRLHYNWIGKRGEDYKRYPKVRPKFDRVYELFREFLQSEKLDIPKENQWEVTYVNHIPRASGWNTPEDWPGLFIGLPGPWGAMPLGEVRPESVAGAWHFEIPPQRGRLHVDLKHVRTAVPEAKELMRLTLTARGAIGKSAEGETALSEGLDLGRRTIVRAFAGLTSTEAHRIWERTDDH